MARLVDERRREDRAAVQLEASDSPASGEDAAALRASTNLQITTVHYVLSISRRILAKAQPVTMSYSSVG